MSRTLASFISAEEKVCGFFLWWTENYPLLLHFMIREAERIAPRHNDRKRSRRVATALFVGLNGLKPLVQQRCRNDDFAFLAEEARVAAPVSRECRETCLALVLSRENMQKLNEATSFVIGSEAQEEIRNAIALVASATLGIPN